MRSRHLIAAVVAAHALVLTAATAAAQGTASTPPGAPRVVATYDFGAARHAITFPSTVTIADSAGVLVASARTADGRTTIPMLVHVIESDLVLEGLTPEGVLTLVLERQAQGDPEPMKAGRWAVGKQEGQLRGRSRG